MARPEPRRRRAAPVLVASLLLVAACGADAGDPAGEARALVETCRALQVRHLGRVDDPPTVEEAERFLALEPGAGAATVARWFREACPRERDRDRDGDG